MVAHLTLRSPGSRKPCLQLHPHRRHVLRRYAEARRVETEQRSGCVGALEHGVRGPRGVCCAPARLTGLVGLAWLRESVPDFVSWGELRSGNMESTAVGDVPLKLGAHYLYCHQGDCEHILVFSDARCGATMSAGHSVCHSFTCRGVVAGRTALWTLRTRWRSLCTPTRQW